MTGVRNLFSWIGFVAAIGFVLFVVTKGWLW